MSWFRRMVDRRNTKSVRRPRSRAPVFEGLESRIVLYSASGNLWPNHQVITISFMPDGTNLGGGVTSNLFSTFNSKPSLDGKWQNVILEAAQEWAAQTNINFVVVPDDGAPEGSGPDEQGDPGFGDIRIGGYNFGSSTLALTYQPPSANNFSIAGDMTFNTGQSFNVGSTYDLFTVAMHEFGHALGLNESSVTGAVEYGTYNGVKTGLASDDIAGIRSIYSNNDPRSPDAYNSNGLSNGTLATAASINSLINTTTLTGLVPNLDLSTEGQVEYFSFTAPSGTANTLELDVQSTGLSLLSPEVTLYASNGTTVLASATGSGEEGSTLTVGASGVTAGEQFYVKVQGAVTNEMGTGNYALGLSFNGSTPPTEASPIIQEPNGDPEHVGDGQADGSSWIGYGIGSPVIAGITPDNGVSSLDGITNNGSFSVYGSAPAGDIITVYRDGTQVGQTIVPPTETWVFNETSTDLGAGTYQFTAMATDPAGNNTPLSSPYEVVIDTHVPDPPVIGAISPQTGASGSVLDTSVNTPTFSGTTEPFAVVALYDNGSAQPFGTTEADASGNWSYTVGQPGTVTYPGASSSLLGAALNPILGLLEVPTPPYSLPNGTNSVTATAMDVAGTWSPISSPETIVVQTMSPPVIAGVSLVSGTSGLLGILGLGQTQQSLSVVGTAPPGAGVQVYLDGTLLGTAQASAQGDWCYSDVPSSPTVAAGIYSWSAISTGPQGAVSAPSATFELQVGGGATAGTPSYSAGTLFGQATPGSLVTIVDGNIVLGVVVAEASGAWQFTPTLTEGKHSIMVEATGSAGYTSVLSTSLSLDG